MLLTSFNIKTLEKMIKIKAYAAQASDTDLEPYEIERRRLNATDVKIDILFCGVCHSDLHQVQNDWKNSKYPVVPGHEIVGKIIEVGDKVTKFKKGDMVGVGCLVDSCHKCEACKDDMEQFCEKGATWTYNSKDTHLGRQTFGGYSESIVVEEQFVLRVPGNLKPEAVAPLLCAGITTWSPLAHWKVKKSDKVGIIGLGGLGHMGIKLAAAMGAKVVMITTSPDKSKDAKRLGAAAVLISKEEDQMKDHKGSFDFLLNTIPVGHDLNPYVALLKRDATMVLVGAIEPLKGLHGGNLIMGRKRIAGSLIGGIKETQEMLDFCGEHKVEADIELIKIQNINTAYDRLKKSDVKYRFVIDMKSLKEN